MCLLLKNIIVELHIKVKDGKHVNHLEFLDERYSIRNFDPEQTIADEEINSILEHTANAPSGKYYSYYIFF